MGYTKRKIRGINFSFLFAAVAFAGWSLFCVLSGQPRSFPRGSSAGFVLFGLAAVFFAAFPLIWARYPRRHPVNHELARFGKLSEMSARLDSEMSGDVEVFGPFRFTSSLLIYDTGLEFQMVPYDQIVFVELVEDEGTPRVALRTRTGRRYEWHRSLLERRFDPEQVLERIRVAAHLASDLAADLAVQSEMAPTEEREAG
jgi:hypothetical protein